MGIRVSSREYALEMERGQIKRKPKIVFENRETDNMITPHAWTSRTRKPWHHIMTPGLSVV